MYKNGFRFEVTKNGVIGEIDGVTAPGIYSVCFYEHGSLYLRADVYESTITNNLKMGAYKELKTNDSWTRDYVCPNCNCKVYPVDIENGDFNFCPNCGKRLSQPIYYLSIDDIMSVFDDFMRGDVNENDNEVFKNMLLDKAESEG